MFFLENQVFFYWIMTPNHQPALPRVYMNKTSHSPHALHVAGHIGTPAAEKSLWTQFYWRDTPLYTINASICRVFYGMFMYL